MTVDSENRSRRLVAFAVGMVGLVVIVVILMANQDGGTALLPDLESEPPGAPAFAIVQWPQGSGELRLVLRFDGVIANVGDGALFVEGDPRGAGFGGDPIAQVLLDADGELVARLVLSTGSSDSAVRFENSDGHDHWHLMRAAEYSLWHEFEDRRVVAGSKVGFCLADVQPIDGIDGQESPSVYPADNQCAAGSADAEYLAMGISPGWADVYSFTIALQWIDVSEVAPGVYRLAGQADPDDVVVESNEDNRVVFRPQPVVVPGYLPIDSDVEAQGSTAFRLSAASFAGTVDLTPDDAGDPQDDVVLPTGAPRFVVIEAPASGTLNVEVGEKFAGPDIVYTPDPGFVGTDSFTFVAIDPGFNDPREPRLGTVTVMVGG